MSWYEKLDAYKITPAIAMKKFFYILIIIYLASFINVIAFLKYMLVHLEQHQRGFIAIEQIVLGK